MYLEYPIREEHVQVFMNRPVGVILHDGTERFGVVTGCGKGKIILNGKGHGEAQAESKHKGRTKGGGKKSNRTQRVNPAPRDPFAPGPVPMPSFGPRVAVELASVSAIFPL